MHTYTALHVSICFDSNLCFCRVMTVKPNQEQSLLLMWVPELPVSGGNHSILNDLQYIGYTFVLGSKSHCIQ